MRQIRPSKLDDQENIEKAYQMIVQLMQLNSQIEETLWACALWTAIVRGYNNSSFSYEEFLEEVNSVTKHYKYSFM